MSRRRTLAAGGERCESVVSSAGEGHLRWLSASGETVELSLAALSGACLQATIAERRLRVYWHKAADGRVWLHIGGRHYEFTPEGRARRRRIEDGADLSAPMPGVITRVLVSKGDRFERGQALYGLEAMKMETLVRAGAAGRVLAVRAAVGEQVEGGAQVLDVEIEPPKGRPDEDRG